MLSLHQLVAPVARLAFCCVDDQVRLGLHVLEVSRETAATSADYTGLAHDLHGLLDTQFFYLFEAALLHLGHDPSPPKESSWLPSPARSSSNHARRPWWRIAADARGPRRQGKWPQPDTLAGTWSSRCIPQDLSGSGPPRHRCSPQDTPHTSGVLRAYARFGYDVGHYRYSSPEYPYLALVPAHTGRNVCS